MRVCGVDLVGRRGLKPRPLIRLNACVDKAFWTKMQANPRQSRTSTNRDVTTPVVKIHGNSMAMKGCSAVQRERMISHRSVSA